MPKQQPQRPAGRPPTPPPGANLSRRMDDLEGRIGSIESNQSQMLQLMRELAGDIRSREAHQPNFQPAIPEMTAEQVQEFEQHVESTTLSVQAEEVKRAQDELDRLARERKVRITVREPDAFIYASERWIFNEVDATFDVPETIGRMFMLRERARADARKKQNTIMTTLTNQAVPLDTMEASVEALLGNRPARRGGMNRGLIQRSRS